MIVLAITCAVLLIGIGGTCGLAALRAARVGGGVLFGLAGIIFALAYLAALVEKIGGVG